MEDIEEINKLREPLVEYGKEYTYADYLNFEFEEMVELIRGKIFRMSPAPRTIHQRVSGNIHRIIAIHLYKQKCSVFHAPFDVILPIRNKKRNKATTVVQPDICVICNPEIIEDAGCFGVPDFLIEIVATKNIKKDVQDKFSVYEEAGVGEYWIVFTELACVEVFVLENGIYKRVNTFVEDDIIPTKTLPDLVIKVSDLFE